MEIKACLFLAFMAAARAQSIADLPDCSLSCFQVAIGQTSCGDTDYVCQCQSANYNTIKSSVTGCLSKSACSLADLQKVQTFSNTFCPNILASASAASAPVTAVSSSQTSPIASSDTQTASSTAQDSSPTSVAANAAATAFGANTPGTGWGAIPQTDSTANRGPAFEAVSIILLCVAAMILAFRFFARMYTKSMRKTVRSVSWDDWLCVVALVGTAGITADIIVGTNYGMGKHLPTTTTLPELVALVKIVYSFVIILTFVLGVLKISILALYARMTPSGSHKLTCYIFMGIIVAHEIASLFGAIFACTPVSEYWDLTTYTIFQNPNCIKILPFDIFNSAWSAMEDVIIWLLPIPIVWGLKVSTRRKAGLWFLLSVSLVPVICSIIRLAVTVVWIRSTDISWNYPMIPFLSNMEACVAIITSSVPAIQPLFRKAQPQPTIETPPSPPKEHVKEWESQTGKSQDSDTALPSTAGGTNSKSSRTWSMLSRLRPNTGKSKERRMASHKQLSAFRSQTGMTTGQRTELKDLEEDGDVDFVPGLPGDKVLRVK